MQRKIYYKYDTPIIVHRSTGGSNMDLTYKIKEEIKKAKSEEEVNTILENVKGGWRMQA